MSSHFEGRSVKDHLKEARLRGSIASAEIHGIEMSGSIAAGADSAKEVTLLLLIVVLSLSALLPPEKLFIYPCLMSGGWILWKTARSALLGWSRIERLHRLIEEERWEIEHHRGQEKQELKEMYAVKGFEGKLLDEVVEVLMADDNRLLRVMIEEELGLSLEAYEHPLKQAWGSFLGAVGSAFLCLVGLWLFSIWGLVAAGVVCIATACTLSARLERNRIWNLLIWHFATLLLVLGTLHFLIPLVLRF